MPPKTTPNPTMPDRAHQDPTRISDLLPELHNALAGAQGQRGRRRGITSNGESQWVTYERAVMVDHTMALLLRHRLPLDAGATRLAVLDAEQQAMGHFDYTSKWALGCAEYIWGIATTAQKAVGS